MMSSRSLQRTVSTATLRLPPAPENRRQPAQSATACLGKAFRSLVAIATSFTPSAIQTATVTFRKVAGIDVAPAALPRFSRSNSDCSSRCSSSALPLAWAAAKAFIVGP
jgi:hypothetical protein